MEILLLVVVAGVALLCPLTMFGPMLLRRIGLMKGRGGQMDCMMMTGGGAKQPTSQVDEMRERRRQLDREIAVVEATLIEKQQPEGQRR